MTLTAPFDILADWPGWTPTFEPLFRQEQSRQTNGVTRLKDFGSPLWQLSTTSKSLRRPILDYWRARLRVLDNGIQTFLGYPMSRRWPMAYPGGAWPTGVSFNGTSAVLHAVADDNKSIQVANLPVGYIVSIGDFLQVGTGDLYQAVETATAAATGITPSFEVRPHLWPTSEVGTAVSVKQPHCLMTVVPGSIATPSDDSGLGKISFQAIEYR